MARIFDIKPEFCHYIPENTEPGILYISKEFQIAIHRCACGCGGETVTPLFAGEWTLQEDGDTVTLRPSIGNWSGESPYHAHYYITANKIEWL